MGRQRRVRFDLSRNRVFVLDTPSWERDGSVWIHAALDRHRFARRVQQMEQMLGPMLRKHVDNMRDEC